jgi:hypothetical protein
LPKTLGYRIPLNSPVPNTGVNNKDHRIQYNGAASDYIGSERQPSTHPTAKTTAAAPPTKSAEKKEKEQNWGEKDKEKRKERDKDKDEKRAE